MRESKVQKNGALPFFMHAIPFLLSGRQGINASEWAQLELINNFNSSFGQCYSSYMVEFQKLREKRRKSQRKRHKSIRHFSVCIYIYIYFT